MEHRYVEPERDPLKVLLLSDGRPGHYRLAEGIVAAVERRRPVSLQRLDCHRGRWPGAVLAAGSNTGWMDGALLRHVYGLQPPLPGQFDLVVSAGAATLAANIAFARLTGAANVFYGSLRAFRPESFSLVLTSYAKNDGKPRHRTVMKPSAIPRGNRPLRAIAPGKPPAVAALLLGGDAGSTTFHETDWQQLLALVRASHASLGVRWIVANSRRTPDDVSDRFAAVAAAPASPLIRFSDVRVPGSGSLASVFAAVDAVLCTDDSSTMISEAIGAGLPTIGVAAGRHTLPPDEAAYRAYLTGQGWHRVLPVAALTPDTLMATLTAITPMTADPLDHLSSLLAEAMPNLFNS